MIRDKLGIITPSFSLVTADGFGGVAASVGDVIDLNQARDVGAGEPLAMHIQCTETLASGGFANATFIVTASNVETLATGPMPLGAMVFTFAGFDAVRLGDRFAIPFGPGYIGGDNPATTGSPGTMQLLYGKRYLGVAYVNQPRTLGGAGFAYTAGKFSIEILPWSFVDKGSRMYAAGFNIV